MILWNEIFSGTRIGGNQCNRKTEIVRNSGVQVLNTDIKQQGLKTTIQSEIKRNLKQKKFNF